MHKVRRTIAWASTAAALAGGSYIGFADSMLDIAGDSPNVIPAAEVYDHARGHFTNLLSGMNARERVIAVYLNPVDNSYAQDGSYWFDNGKTRVRQKTLGNGVAALWAGISDKLERDVRFGDDCLKGDYKPEDMSVVDKSTVLANPHIAGGVVLTFTQDSFGFPVSANAETEGVLLGLGCNVNYHQA